MDIPFWFSPKNISEITAVIAILISFYSIYRSYKTDKKYEPILDLQKEIAALDLKDKEQTLLDNKKAIFKVFYNTSDKPSKLIISNYGKCDAKNMSILIEDNSPTLKKEITEFNTNISEISSMNDHGFLASHKLGGPNYDEIKIVWDDEEKKGKTKTFKIKTY